MRLHLPRLHPASRCLAWLAALLGCLWLTAGCGQRTVNQALDSDANGYLCPACQTKFYTERDIFANHCPKCQEVRLLQVVGYVCPADNHVTLGARGRGSLACEQCGKATASLCIPRQKDFQTWGAAKKTGPEVGVN